MKSTIRLKFFYLLSIYTFLVFCLIGVLLFAFNIHEQLEHPAQSAEEAEEFFIIVGFMALLFPVTLMLAWYVTSRLLRPWRSLLHQAEQIGNGALEERIITHNPADEIGRLATTLNQAFDRYRMLVERMERYNYDASHQLRNPLAAIRTAGEVCLKHPRTEEEYREVISDVLEETNRLSGTVNQLLLLARCTTDAVLEQMRRVDLKTVLSDVVAEAEVIGELRSLSVRLRCPYPSVEINAIPELLRESFANLLDNALKYSPDNASIECSVRLLEDGFARIEICDSGPGLTLEQKATVFRPFVRSRQDESGTGIGLAIVADVCRIHHARFGVENASEGGACFWIEFPMHS